jgi:hypothetical protein
MAGCLLCGLWGRRVEIGAHLCPKETSAGLVNETAARVPDLDSRTLAEHFDLELPPYATTETINGLLADALLDGRIDRNALTDLHGEVWAAVCALEWEIGTGLVSRKPRLVGGRPLADWLTLDDVARLLREGGR